MGCRVSLLELLEETAAPGTQSSFVQDVNRGTVLFRQLQRVAASDDESALGVYFGRIRKNPLGKHKLLSSQQPGLQLTDYFRPAVSPELEPGFLLATGPFVPSPTALRHSCQAFEPISKYKPDSPVLVRLYSSRIASFTFWSQSLRSPTIPAPRPGAEIKS